MDAELAFLVGSLAILGGYLAILDADLAIWDGSWAILDAALAFLSANLAVPRGGVIRTPKLGYIIIMVPDPPLHPLRRPGTLARPQAGGI